MNPKQLTNEQIERAKLCRNAEEILALAEEEGIELTEEQLGMISGGDLAEWSEQLGTVRLY